MYENVQDMGDGMLVHSSFHTAEKELDCIVGRWWWSNVIWTPSTNCSDNGEYVTMIVDKIWKLKNEARVMIWRHRN